MDNTNEVAQQVGIFGAIATFFLGLFGIHRHNKEKMDARLHELDTRKADRVELRESIDRLDASISHLDQRSEDRHNTVMQHLLRGRE